MPDYFKSFIIILIFIIACVFNNLSFAQQLYSVPDGVTTRWASPENWQGEKGVGGLLNGGRKGSASFTLHAGERKILAEVTGQHGMIRRIWMTIDNRSAKMLRGIKLEIFWDGAATPAVNAPLGDFFGQGLGKMSTLQNELFSSPEGKSFNCLVPMPFKQGMKVVVTNETDEDQSMFFYDIDYTLGDHLEEDVLYFHAYFRRENPTQLKQDYAFLPTVKGKGRLLGVNFSVIVNKKDYLNTWWGEGEVKIYLDDDGEHPTLCGTGTEDYIGTGWGQGVFNLPFQGCTFADPDKMHYAFYRYHIPDPVYFQQEIKATIQQIGFAKGAELQALAQAKKTVYKTGEAMQPVDFANNPDWLLFERSDNVASCVYFYLSHPENGLPPLIPYQERIAGL